MAIELADLFRLQLAQQAALHNLTQMRGRKRSAQKLAILFQQLMEELSVSHTLEVGAHEAAFSRAVKKKLGDTVTARAYEANPEVYALYKADPELKTLGVDYLYQAIGAENGLADFHISATINGEKEDKAGRLHSCLKRMDAGGTFLITVPQARLDQICQNDPGDSRYGLWIDAEGTGLQVLRGADGILGRTVAIFIELESIARYDGQALDMEVMNFLLEHDFMPIARDFQFAHQYNCTFVQKELLPMADALWHRYFQRTLRKELAISFELEEKTSPPMPVRPAPHELPKFRSVAELRDAAMELEPVRKSRHYTEAPECVIACRVEDLELAQKFYADKRNAQFYVAGLDEGLKLKSCHSISKLTPGMDAQLFCRQGKRPDDVSFNFTAIRLNELGIAEFGVESWSQENFYRYRKKRVLSGKDWETALNFVNLLADNESKRVYLAIMRSEMEGDPGYLPYSPYPQYQHPLVKARPGDIVCEGGCYPDFSRDGTFSSSTLRIYGDMEGKGRIYCFEPLPHVCEKLQHVYASRPGIEVANMALWSENGSMPLAGTGAATHLGAKEEKGAQCQCVSIDSFFADKKKPDLIKMDVEGAEMNVLEGSINTLRAYMPKLMLSIYHARRGPDWLRVPRFLLDTGLPYLCYCGHHGFWFNESIVYGTESYSAEYISKDTN